MFLGGSSCPDPIECSDPNPRGSGVRQLLPPPSFDSETLSWWHSSLQSMREACQHAIGYNGSVETVQELKWTQTAYMSPQMHPCVDGRIFSIFFFLILLLSFSAEQSVYVIIISTTYTRARAHVEGSLSMSQVRPIFLRSNERQWHRRGGLHCR